MNRVTFQKNEKLQSRNRSGMIRSYRTARTLKEISMLVLDLFLHTLDQILDFLVRPTILRVLRSVVALGCICAFLCLISAVESQSLSLSVAGILAVLLMAVEIACLRGN